MTGTSWRDDALCIGIPLDIFYPPEWNGNYPTLRQLCGRCPVQTQCLEQALTYEENTAGRRYGFWGGMSPGERHKLAQQRRKQTAA